MKAIELRDGTLQIVDRPRPEPAEGETRVKVELAGICSTDLHLKAGYMEFTGVPGHEFVGRNENGDLVVGEINAGCDDCAEPRHCPHRTVLGILGRDGSFAEELTLPKKNLRTVSLPPERALFVEPVAAAFQILEQVAVKDRKTLVLGCGKLGALCARVLKLGGAHVDIATSRPESAAFLTRDGFPLVEPERGYDLVVESSGHPDGFPRALELVRPRGTVVLKSTCATGRPLNLAPVVIDEVSVVGSRCGPFGPAIEALQGDDFRPEETIADRFPLERFKEAFALAEFPKDPARRKVVFV